MSSAAAHRFPTLTDLSCRERGGRHTLDLSARGWIDPAHLVGVAALAHAHANAGHDLQVIGPSRRSQHLYAARMHLGQVLSALSVEHNFPTVVPERDRREDLLEVRAVHTEDDANALAEVVSNKVRPDSARAAQALFACVSEMATNVADHSGTVGYVAAQTLPQVGVIRFAVADAGRGVLATLAVRGAITDRQAALMALNGESRFDDPSRGTGLPTTRRELTRLDGFLYLVSGTASVKATSAATSSGTLRSGFAGTLIEGLLRVPR